MKLADEQIRRICAAILSRWKSKGLIHSKESDEAILACMTAEIRKDIKREEDLDLEAAKLLERHAGKADAAQANTRILFQKIKERLAQERGVVL
jgi:hypothetical protein